MSDILGALNSDDPKKSLSKIMESKNSDQFKTEMKSALKSLTGNISSKQKSLSLSSGAGITGSIAGALNSSIAALSSEQTSQFSSDEVVKIGNLLDVVQKGGLSIKSLFGMIFVAEFVAFFVNRRLEDFLGQGEKFETDLVRCFAHVFLLCNVCVIKPRPLQDKIATRAKLLIDVINGGRIFSQFSSTILQVKFSSHFGLWT